MLEKPILTIAIPTYKRADLLRSLLFSLMAQVSALDGKVEVVVSDNCSPDHTRDVVEWAQQFGPIRYHRNEENIGAARNFVQLTQKLALGEYCWLIGDDDLVRPGAVAALVEGLESYPEIDYAFVNYTLVVSERDGALITADQFPDISRRQCFVTETKVVPRWEELITFTNYESLFTYIGCHVLRTKLWRAQEIPVTDDKDFPSMMTTFPHAYIAALHMVGRPVLYIEEPGIIVMIGAQDWNEWVPLIRIVRTVEFADFMEKSGVSRAVVRRYRNLLFEAGCYDFWMLAVNPKAKGRQNFHAARYLRYVDHSKFWRMLLLYPFNTYIKPMFRPIARLRKLIASRN